MSYAFDAADRRRDQIINHLRRRARDSADRRLSPTAQRIRAAAFTLIAPRLAADAEMPDLTPAVEGVTSDNFRARRKMIADRVRKLVRDKIGKDEDLSGELDRLLEALGELEPGEGEEEGEDHIFDRHATDEPEPFPGRPQPGGRMDPMRDYNNTRFPQTQTDPAEGPLDGEDRARRRRAHDSAPQSFADRFPFTTAAAPGAVDWTKIS